MISLPNQNPNDPPKRTKIGAPTKLTPELSKTFLKAVKVGSPISDCCLIAGINRTTYFNWKIRSQSGKKSDAIYLDFFNAIKKAQSERRKKALAVVLKAAPKQWQAAAWFLERSDPKHWAKPDPSTPTVVIDNRPQPLPDAIAARINADLTEHESRNGNGTA